MAQSGAPRSGLLARQEAGIGRAWEFPLRSVPTKTRRRADWEMSMKPPQPMRSMGPMPLTLTSPRSFTCRSGQLRFLEGLPERRNPAKHKRLMLQFCLHTKCRGSRANARNKQAARTCPADSSMRRAAGAPAACPGWPGWRRPAAGPSCCRPAGARPRTAPRQTASCRCPRRGPRAPRSRPARPPQSPARRAPPARAGPPRPGLLAPRPAARAASQPPPAAVPHEHCGH